MTRHLPVQTTSFIGREHELDDIENRLIDDNCHLLTLVGGGGIGKTRLAIATAHRLSTQFRDGVLFVPLQPIASADDILPKIVTLLGTQNYGSNHTEQIVQLLADKHLLLILDNFEHLMTAVPIISEIIMTVPTITLLITSREPLNLQAEWLYHVRGLLYPTQPDQDNTSYNAIQLFSKRASAVRRDFSLDDEYDHVVRICQLVEGMPLAIELASSWLRRLSCADIADEIANSIEILATTQRDVPDRHGSIRTVFDTSWEALNAEERDTFKKSSIFKGGFTRSAVQAITGASIQHLSSLIDKSLLRLTSNGRYELHELLRQYAQEKLGADETQLRDAHCEYYLNLLHDLTPDMMGRNQLEALATIEADLDNIRLAWSLACEKAYAKLLADALFTLSNFYICRTRWNDKREIMRQALTSMTPKSDAIPSGFYGLLLTLYTGAISSALATEAEIQEMERGISIVREYGTKKQLAKALFALAYTLIRTYDDDRGLIYADEAYELQKQVTPNNQYLLSERVSIQANYHSSLHEYDLSIALWRQYAEIHQATGAIQHEATGWSRLGYDIMAHTGNFREAIRHVQRGYDLRQSIHSLDGIAMSGIYLAMFSLLAGDFAKARHHATEALRVGGKTGGWKQHIFSSTWVMTYLAIADAHYGDTQNLVDTLDAMPDLHNRQVPRYPVVGLDLYVLLALTAYSQDEISSAREHLKQSFGYLDHIRPSIFITRILLPSALLIAYEDDYQYATKLVALALETDGSHAKFMAHFPLITDFISLLKSKIGVRHYDDDYEQGTTLDLEETKQALKRWLTSPSESDAIREANQTLDEPLTERELEILQLLADGLSNRQIAHELVVSLGTVKKHNNNIFGKLQASSRTQVVAIARDIGLLI